MSSCAYCLPRCLGCLFCDFLCCQCNCILFPSPRCSYDLHQSQTSGDLWYEFKVFNSSSSLQAIGKQVPYLKVSTRESRASKRCFIYFHGNAEDIGTVRYFLAPIVEKINITFYAIQYPGYGIYESITRVLISNTIKDDSLNFYQFIKGQENRKDEDIYIMGRSIGSGGASYLSGHKPSPVLILMSPFDSIKNVAKGLLGCCGGLLVKQHFDNEEQIVNFKGKVLIIHGQQDEVIKVSHGKQLGEKFMKQRKYQGYLKQNYPKRMTHNNFDIIKDIIEPIQQFLAQELKQTYD